MRAGSSYASGGVGTRRRRAGFSEKRFVLVLAGGLLAAIVLVSLLAPGSDDSDPSPSTYNSGSAGVKAAYLLLPELGYGVDRWEDSAGALRDVDAAQTTLVLANPVVAQASVDEVKAGLADFLGRGGRVLVTGVQGADLAGGSTSMSAAIYKETCITTPEGQGALARVGPVSMPVVARWADDASAVRVQQRCGADAVVVSFKVGAGEVVWWSSPMPMTNRGLKEDASLKLLLASVGGPGRRILFDERLHGGAPSVWDEAKGLPIRSLVMQVGVVAVLLVLSFGRRSGPLWRPVRAVRSSPLEFAESMGHLYQKAGATRVAMDGARRRLLRFLKERCGVQSEMPEEIVESLQVRLGGDWSAVGEHLNQAQEDGGRALSASSALALVKAIDEDLMRLKKRVEFQRG